LNTILKWLLIVTGGLGAVLVLLVLFLKFYVGVNLPLIAVLQFFFSVDVELDTAKLGNQIQLPDGFSMGIYAADVPNARVIRFTRQGDLLVANPSRGKVLILGRDENGDGRAESNKLLIDGLNGPNGLDFFEDWLYIAEQDAIGRVKFDHQTGEIRGEYERIVRGLPGGGNHPKKTLRFGPDNLMYVAMGSSCNVCIEADERRAAMIRYNPDGSGEHIFAQGMRNSAGFDWSPVDGHIYATDNGRDLLGDDFPPCELNRIEEGHHYGWPFANGNKIPDPDFGEDQAAIIEDSVAPVHGFRPHNAPLGMEFVRGDAFPEEYHGAAIVALHGSWNRRDKDGYKVVSLHWDGQGNITEKDFVSGFLQDDDVIGRPAEVTQGPDGAFYIADDYVGVIYRVAYGEEQKLEIAKVESQPVFHAEESLAGYSEDERAELSIGGGKLFREKVCISCHNPNSGLKLLENLGARYDVQTLSRFLEKPQPPMPVYPLSAADKEALSVFLIENY